MVSSESDSFACSPQYASIIIGIVMPSSWLRSSSTVSVMTKDFST